MTYSSIISAVVKTPDADACVVSGVMYVCIHGAVNLPPLSAKVSAPYCILFCCGKQVDLLQ